MPARFGIGLMLGNFLNPYNYPHPLLSGEHLIFINLWKGRRLAMKSKMLAFLSFVKNLDSENREHWLKAAGKAVHLFDGDGDGFTLFDRWSATAGNYDQEASRDLYYHFSGDQSVPSRKKIADKKYINPNRIATFLRKQQPASENHPYLIKKQIFDTFDLYQQGDQLLIPLTDEKGHVTSYQSISPKGQKRFLKGSKVKGSFHEFLAVYSDMNDPVYIAEGYATAYAIHYGTGGHRTLAAMSLNNLEPVAKMVRRANPDITIIIVTDNDYDPKTGRNPGLEVGRRLSATICDYYITPVSKRDRNRRCDFNDIRCNYSRERLVERITNRCV